MAKTKTAVVTVDTTEVKRIEKDIAPVVAKADKIIVIKNDKELEVATEVLSKLNVYADSVKAEKKKLTEPANATLKAIKALFAPLEEKVLPKIEAIRGAMSVYQTEKSEKAEAEAAAIADRVRKGKGGFSEETAMRKIDEIEKPIEKIVTDSGSLGWIDKQTLEVMDLTLIPREYLVVDEKKVLEALKAGVDVAGARIKVIKVPRNTR
jgi:hypothetical protein